MNWQVRFLPEARDDIRALDGSQRLLVRKAIEKVSTNPLPNSEGGYGKPLGNRNKNELAGFLKVKLRGPGLRIVYKLIRQDSDMLVVIVGAREDDEVYDAAHQRIQKYKL